MTVRRTMMFCADTMRIFSSITTRASVSIEAVLFSVLEQECCRIYVFLLKQ